MTKNVYFCIQIQFSVKLSPPSLKNPKKTFFHCWREVLRRFKDNRRRQGCIDDAFNLGQFQGIVEDRKRAWTLAELLVLLEFSRKSVSRVYAEWCVKPNQRKVCKWNRLV